MTLVIISHVRCFARTGHTRLSCSGGVFIYSVNSLLVCCPNFWMRLSSMPKGEGVVAAHHHISVYCCHVSMHPILSIHRHTVLLIRRHVSVRHTSQSLHYLVDTNVATLILDRELLVHSLASCIRFVSALLNSTKLMLTPPPPEYYIYGYIYHTKFTFDNTFYCFIPFLISLIKLVLLHVYFNIKP